MAGSEVVASLATKVRPRYHVCGGKDVFYARPPYLNKDLGAGVPPRHLPLCPWDTVCNRVAFMHLSARVVPPLQENTIRHWVQSCANCAASNFLSALNTRMAGGTKN